ncbi:MAG: LacI family DNA-binding transcriptional regulator [Herpetosiphon sp.]
MADVARAAGVSAQTVSRVVNNKGEISSETRQLVMDVIERLGYRPSSIARSLATNRSGSLGLVVPDLANPFFSEIARGAEDVAKAHNYAVFMCNTVENAAREVSVLHLLEEKRVDGLVLCSSRLADEELIQLLGTFPAAVVVNRSVPTDIAGVVRVDDARGTFVAVEHLVSSQRHTIALVSGPPTSWSGRQRVHGFEQALEAAGRFADPRLQVACRPDPEGGFDAVRHLLTERPDIDGLVCYNDLVAVGAVRACQALGVLVPEQVALVGCDDIVLAPLVTPALTTLRVSKYQIGAVAVRMLLDRMAGRNGAEGVVVPELVVRASAPYVVGRAPANVVKGVP